MDGLWFLCSSCSSHWGLSAQGTEMQIQPFGTIPKSLKSPKVTKSPFENTGLCFQTATSLREGTAPKRRLAMDGSAGWGRRAEASESYSHSRGEWPQWEFKTTKPEQRLWAKLVAGGNQANNTKMGKRQPAQCRAGVTGRWWMLRTGGTFLDVHKNTSAWKCFLCTKIIAVMKKILKLLNTIILWWGMWGEENESIRNNYTQQYEQWLQNYATD